MCEKPYLFNVYDLDFWITKILLTNENKTEFPSSILVQVDTPIRKKRCMNGNNY